MDYQAEIARLQKLARDEDKAARAQQQEAWNQLVSDPASWEWRVTNPVMNLGDVKELWADCERCLVHKRVRPELMAEWVKGGYSSFSNDWQSGRWFGAVYVRTDEGILTHVGGGHLILRDPMLTSPEEWAQIVSGDIPEKYKRK